MNLALDLADEAQRLDKSLSIVRLGDKVRGLSFYQSIYLSSISIIFISLPTYLSIYLSIHLCICMFVCLSIYLYLYMYCSTNLSPSSDWAIRCVYIDIYIERHIYVFTHINK